MLHRGKIRKVASDILCAVPVAGTPSGECRQFALAENGEVSCDYGHFHVAWDHPNYAYLKPEHVRMEEIGAKRLEGF